MSTVKSNADHLTLNADGASKDIKFQANGVEKASISSTGAFTSTSIDATKLTGNLPAISGASLTNLPSSGGGKVKQILNYKTGAVATGTTTIPRDDTIPQITQGNEFMTLAITPTSATSRLVISVSTYTTPGATSRVSLALFQDTTANALAATMFYTQGGAELTDTLVHNMVSGTTSATTFRVRAGMNLAGTLTFNGYNGSRHFGGVAASSITITEYEV